MHVRKGDQVMVIAGRDRGKRGRVLRVYPTKRSVLVEGVNLIKKHTRANPRLGVKGGILEREAPLSATKVMPIDPETSKPTRVGRKFVQTPDGRLKKIRVARRSGAELDR